jgi:hypothetical protein
MTDSAFRSAESCALVLSLYPNDLYALLVEDLQVHLKFVANEAGKRSVPKISFASYLLNSFFLKNPNDLPSNYLDVNKFLQFLNNTNRFEGAEPKFGDAMNMLFQISANMVLLATDALERRPGVRSGMRDHLARPMLRNMHNLLVSDKVCAILFEAPHRIESAVEQLERMICAITDKDSEGSDPGSFLEGLVYGLAASFMIQLGRQKPNMKDATLKRLKNQMKSQQNRQLYDQMAMPMQQQYIRANQKFNV